MVSNPAIDKVVSLSHQKDILVGKVSFQSVAFRSLFLLCFTAIFALITFFSYPQNSVAFFVVSCLALGTGVLINFKPLWAGWLSPVYAAFEGMLLGAFTFLMELSYPGIAIEASMITLAVSLGASALYSFGLVKVSGSFRRVVAIGTVGIGIIYLSQLILAFLGMDISFLRYGWAGLVINAIAFFLSIGCLFVDFERVHEAVEAGLSDDYSWFCAFSIVVTVLWMYVEVLKLLARSKRRR